MSCAFQALINIDGEFIFLYKLWMQRVHLFYIVMFNLAGALYQCIEVANCVYVYFFVGHHSQLTLTTNVREINVPVSNGDKLIFTHFKVVHCGT